MAFSTDTIGKSFSVATDATGTIGVFKLPGGSIERAYESKVLLSPDEAFDYRIDVGVLPDGTSEANAESDVQWFQGAVSKSKSNSSDEIDKVTVTGTYLRVVVTTAASGGSQSTIACAVGR